MAQVDLTRDNESAAVGSVTAERPGPARKRVWLLLTALVPLLAFWEGLSLNRIFYVRDLSFYYWPAHQWARRLFLAGELPLWDPYPGLGQSAIGEAARQLLFPPAILFRVLLPDVLGFNLFVATASSVAAVGMFLFLRKHHSESGAALGALIFALSGPVLSLGNMPNHAWTLAVAPWCFAAAEEIATAKAVRGFLGFAVATGAQALAAEPVSLAVTSGLCLIYVAVISESVLKASRAAALVLLGSVTGFAIAAIQMFPLADAVLRSQRTAVVSGNVLPVHPLSLVETLAWPVFGNPFDRWDPASPWLRAFNGEADPYLFSLYVGIGSLALAAGGAVAGWRTRRSAFWIACLVICTVLAFGVHTPIYPALREIVPIFALFRYPSKYLCFAALGLAALAAMGWDSTAPEEARRRTLLGVGLPLAAATLVGLAIWLSSLLAGGGLERIISSAAYLLGVAESSTAVPALEQSLSSGAFRLFVLAAAIGAILLLSIRRHSFAHLFRAALFVIVVVDLFSVNAALNPAFDTSPLGSPDWAQAIRSDPSARTYVPGRVDFYFSDAREEGYGQLAPELRQLTTQQASAITNVRFVAFPAEARVREAISMDLTSIWPREYKFLIHRYGNSTGTDRIRFLERSGVRFFLLQRPPPGGQLLRSVDRSNLSVFERPAASPRAGIVTRATVIDGVEEQINTLFLPEFDPAATVVLGGEPPDAAGVESAPGDGAARIVEDGSNSVRLTASVPEGGGYLLLRDRWDPYWSATADGQPAEVLRAYGLFRAVRLAPGEHEVVFTYRPTPFYVGCGVSAATAILLLALWLVSRRRVGDAGILPRHGEETVR